MTAEAMPVRTYKIRDDGSLDASSMTEAPRRQTPTEFARELAMAYATKEPLGRSETVELGSPSTGALAGKLVVGKVSLNRDEDETLAAWVERVRLVTAEALKLCLVFNDESYRDELLREALREIREGNTDGAIPF